MGEGSGASGFSKELYCRECDIVFRSRSKLHEHFSLYHDELPANGSLPRQGTLTCYLGSGSKEEESQHEFAVQNLQRPAKCSLCNQIIWEIALSCTVCKVRCHRGCSDRISSSCFKSTKSYKPMEHPGAAKTLGFDLLRRKVCENKMRYVDSKWDLDLSYISPRIIAMSFPASGLEGAYRNKLHDVAELLESKHKDKYLIINVSDRTYDISVFKNQVLEFGWPDHHAPSMNTLCCIVKTMDSWLRQDPEHVVVCHCKGGKGRTGVAIAAYIQFNNECLTAEEALDKFAVRRFYDESAGGVTQPSQRRIVHYFSSLIKNEVQLENRQLLISTLILFGCPLMDGKAGANICFCVYQGFKPVHRTSVYGVTPAREHVYISLDDLPVESDVMIKAFHVGKTGKTCILRAQFHTAFVKNDYTLVFRKKDIDISCRDDRFPEDGVLQVIFKPRASKVTDHLDSSAHTALVSDQREAREIEEMSKDMSLMSFDYADFSSFFTSNPLRELKQNELLDGILTLNQDYNLISPLLPSSSAPLLSSSPVPLLSSSPDQDSGKGDSPPAPPLPPKGSTREYSPQYRELATTARHTPAQSTLLEEALERSPRPALPPRASRPPPLSEVATSALLESQEEDYLAFEIATPVRNLVQQFEEETQDFSEWVRFDQEEPGVGGAGGEAHGGEGAASTDCMFGVTSEESSVTVDANKGRLVSMRSEEGQTANKGRLVSMRSEEGQTANKGRLVSMRSEEGQTANKGRLVSMRSEEGQTARAATLDRAHVSVQRKSDNSVEMPKCGNRQSAYIPYLQRKRSVKKDKEGKKRYIPYKIRTDSLGTSSRSSSESSGGAFLSPPPLPPRGDKAAPGTEQLEVPPRRLNSLSKSMDNLPDSSVFSRQTSLSSNKVHLELDPADAPDSVECSLANWERVQKRKTIQQTRSIWFKPSISRQESQATLVTQCPGAFIIRKSQTQAHSYGLTIRLQDGRKHDDFNLHPGSHKVSNFLILRAAPTSAAPDGAAPTGAVPAGNLYIHGYESVTFATLEQLVEHFTTNTGGLPHPLCVPTQPYADRIEAVVPMLLRHVSFPVFLLEKRCIRYLPLDSFEEDNVSSLLTETLCQVPTADIRLISMSVTKQGISLTDPDCVHFDTYNVPYKQIKNCEVGARDQTIVLPVTYLSRRTNTFGLIHRDKHSEIIYIALAEHVDTGLSITKTINKFRSYLV